MQLDARDYERPLEQFEVVTIKRTAAEMSAKSSDFKRIMVMAADPLAAILSKEVQTEKEYRALCATKPGILTEPEVLARRREYEGDAIDRSKI